MRGQKPQTKIVPIGTRPYSPKSPSWLTDGAKREWHRCAVDLNRRGILFEGAKASLATYCMLIDQIETLAGMVAAEGPVGPAQKALLAAAREARQLAAELGLSVVSRSRSFQGKAADEQAWSDLDVG